MKRIRILFIALMIALFLPAQVRSDDPASVSPKTPSAAVQGGEDSAGGSALFGVLILAPSPTEAPEQPVQAELILDFSDYDPALDPEDPLVRYDIENEQVTVDFLRVLRQELSGDVRMEQNGAFSDEDREKLTALAERYQEEQKNEQTEQTASLRLEQNLLILTGDGELTLSDGENSLRLEVKGSDALVARHMARDDVQVDVIEGFVPAGSGLSYEAMDADEAESLAQLYLSSGGLRKDETLPAVDTGKKLMNLGPKKTASLRQVSPAGASATGYSAFELSIVRDEQPVDSEGEYAVTLPLPAEAANLVPRGARQKNISYTLYHVHGETVDQLDVLAEGDVLRFTTPNFSTFILQYTVDFEYVDPETGELYAYSLPGGQETLLSGLLSALSVEADLAGSEAVFTDPSLLELEPVSGGDGETADWRVRSLMPFDSEEQLTVRLKNGAEVILRVTDEQIVTRIMDAKGDTYEITVTYGRDARIPYDAKLQACEILPDDDVFQGYLDQAGAALDSELEKEDIRLFDIAIVSGGEKVDLGAPVRVDISFVPMEYAAGDDLALLHFEDNRRGPVRVEDPSFVTAEDEVRGVSFTADGFSVYAVVNDVPVCTFYFYTLNEYLEYEPHWLNSDTEHPVYKQIVRSGDRPVAPQNPVNPQDQEAVFAGWYEGTSSYTTTTRQDLHVQYDFSRPLELTEDTEAHLYAVFSHYHYVIFHDQYDQDTGTFPIAFTRRFDESGESHDDWYVNLRQYSVAYQDPENLDDTQMVFTGWSLTPITVPGAAADDYGDPVAAVKTDTEGRLEVTKTIHLYPIFQPAKWMSYYSGPSGSHATYYSDTYHPSGEGPKDLPGSSVMTRNPDSRTGRAYDFAGWYAGAALDASGEVIAHEDDQTGELIPDGAVQIARADGTLVENANYAAGGISVVSSCPNNQDPHIHLTGSSVTLYAFWKPRTTAEYAVVIVNQKAQENSTEYEFAERFTRTGIIGDPVEWEDAFEQLNTLAGYNALHPDAEITDNETGNPYHALIYDHTDYNESSPQTIAADGSTVVYVYYNWEQIPDMSGKKFVLKFADSMDPGRTIPIVDNSVTYQDKELNYGEQLSRYVPENPVSSISEEGLLFNGWYADKACTMRAFFTEAEYEAYTGSKALFETMPGAPLTFYAGWSRQWFLINIDPNYGELFKKVDGSLVGTGATWMWKEYGDTFQEYTTAKRDYVESDAGSWYYVKKDRDYYGYPSTYVDGESQERQTYYTQIPSEATELTTFKYDPNVYRYAGWYEVLFDDNGQETGEAPERYNFENIVDHNITLRLRWMKAGVFYLQYNAGEGALDDDDESETLYLELDGNSYADDADVVVTRTANPPEGYEFTGWHIRQDDSGAIYRPGQTFHLLSQHIATVQGKRTVFLDAVYEKVPSATIVYHANGGTVNPAGVDYGRPADSAYHDFTTSFDSTEQTATISRLVNNSEVYLSDGSVWLSRESASFAGWCEKEVCDPSDPDAPLLTTEELYRVGANEGETAEESAVHLYAVWQVDVVYHLNEDTSNASFGESWGEGYTLNADGDAYTRSAFDGTAVSWPPQDPVYTGAEGKTFLCWAEGDAENGYTRYDFDHPVDGPTDLYAQWTEAYLTTVTMVDTSSPTTVDRTEEWTPETDGRHGVIRLSSAKKTPEELAAAHVSSVPGGYSFAFATTAREDMMQHLQEHPIQQIYYKAQDGKVHLVYGDGTDEPLADDAQIYFVYYSAKELNIRYKLMEISGNLTAVTGNAYISHSSSAPEATGDLGGYDLTEEVTAPLAALVKEGHQVYSAEMGMDVPVLYYSYAIGGAAAATNAEGLSVMTDSSESDDTRPGLRIENTWQGFRYSTDGGNTWSATEYDPTLYVIYYTEQPTVVTVQAETVGLAADEWQQYEIDYWIEEILLDSNGEPTGTPELVFSTRNVSAADPSVETPFAIPAKVVGNGSTYSAFLFTSPGHTYRVTFVQKQKTGFTVTVPTNGDSVLPSWATDASQRPAKYCYTDDDLASTYSYTVFSGDPDLGKTHYVTFTNTRESVPIELHVLKVEVETGGLINGDAWRSTDPEDYSFDLPLGETRVLDQELPADSFVVAPERNYDCGAVVYGSDHHDEAGQGQDPDSVALGSVPLDCDSVSLEKTDPSDQNCRTYGIYLKDAEGNRYQLTELEEQIADGASHVYKIYYLYHPLLTIHYVLEDSSGNLSLITGSNDGEDVVEEITYGRQPLTLNDRAVTRTQAVSMHIEGLTVTQQIGQDENGNRFFNIPPVLDNGIHQKDLVYYKMGARPQADYTDVAGNISELNPTADHSTGTTETLTLHTRIVNNRLSWKFEDEADWCTISNWPVVYAIYRERGYNLTVTKTVTAETGYAEPFQVTVESTVIHREHYSVDGTGYSTIQAVAASGGTPGTITFDVKDGDSVTIIGLSPGDYTITESGNENFILSAEVKLTQDSTASPVSVGVTDNSTVSLTGEDALRADTTVQLTNRPEYICRIGSHKFYTISSAVQYIIEFDADFTETIEMLVPEYLMPATDTPEIPTFLHVTLTTAEPDADPDNQITEAGTATVITRKSNLTGPMFSNLGALTLGSITLDGNSTDENDASREYPAAMINNAGTLTVAEGATLRNASHGGSTSKGGAVYSRKGAVNVTGGVIEGCTAVSGGAIYAENGTVTVSGGTLRDNSAASGGAICYAGGDSVTISGGNIGEQDHPNTAKEGGAVYMSSGTANITGGSMQYNQASASGGAMYALNSYINVSGGNISCNTAGAGGGAIHMETLTLTVSGGILSHNIAADGGAVWARTGSVKLSGGTLSDNEAAGTLDPETNTLSGGCGGAVYTESSAVTMSGGKITGNRANQDGGGVYAETASVTYSGGSNSAISNNTAVNGNGGGICANSGSVSVTSSNAKMTGNSAPGGNGGALWIGTGSATLQNSIIGTKENTVDSTLSNQAVNGSGVYVDSGSLTFKDKVYVKGNTASAGGAVSMGSDEARIYFSGDVNICNNSMGTGEGAVKSNVYLDFDTDAILNFQSVTNNTNIGIYVSDREVPQEGGGTTTVLARRGVPSARFGVYVSSTSLNVSKITNDRTSNLIVAADQSNKKVYWVRNFNIKIYYVSDYSQGLPFGSKDYTNGFATSGGNYVRSSSDTPSSYQNAASEVAEHIRSSGYISQNGSHDATAVFGHAFVQADTVAEMSYPDYLTGINWNTETNLWDFVQCDGDTVSGGQNTGTVKTLLFIFTEPYYLSIENNAKDDDGLGRTLVISGLNVTLNGGSQSVTGNYGYLFARNDEIQNNLRPVASSDLVLGPGESVRILLPGGKEMNYELTGTYYNSYNPENPDSSVPAGGTVPYTQRLIEGGEPSVIGTSYVEAGSVRVEGTTPQMSGSSHEVIFGGDRAICRVVVNSRITDGSGNPVTTGFVSDHEGAGNTAGKWEYTFNSPRQAYAFISNHPEAFRDGSTVKATLELLVDYMYPQSEQVSLQTGGGLVRDIAFQTSVDGWFRYDPQNTKDDGSGSQPRAVVSRGAGNNESFIIAPNGTLSGGDYVDRLTLKNLVFDGKNFGGDNISGGIVRTKGWNVEIDNVDFNNCQAQFGGGIFIESANPNSGSKTPYGSLKVTNSRFTNCQSKESKDKYGGGAIWTSMKNVTITGCSFNACESVRQGGAVFHYIGGTYDSTTTVTGCSFDNCKSQAAGSMESGARTITVTDTAFRNSTATERNGGALNVWALDKEKPTDSCSVTLENCYFENCYCLNGTGNNGNGGAMRSTAKTNTIKNCTFINALGNNGGAINIYNENADQTTVSGCTFNGCSARDRGGAIFCRSKKLTIDSYADVETGSSAGTSIHSCYSANEGGGVYHSGGTELKMENTVMDSCHSNSKGGGGLYTAAAAVTVTDSTVQNCYTVAKEQNGGGMYLSGSTSTTLSGTTVQGCTATGMGGGVYHGAAGTFTVKEGCLISGNRTNKTADSSDTSDPLNKKGGGIYSGAAFFTLENSAVTDNSATGNGGGICHNYSGSDGGMTVNGATVTDNISGGQGGGLFTLTNLTLQGITSVTGNRLTTETEEDAAGVYLRDGVTLSLGETGGTKDQHVFTIQNNMTAGGKHSNLRLPDKTSGEIVNDNKVKVFCGIDGNIRVVNAKKKLTQFGTAQGSLTNPAGFTDEYKVFWSEDDSLYGIVDRQDTSGTKIIWGGDPICKITDGQGHLLYIDDQQVRPAVFDRLDALTNNHASDTTTTSAFSTLRRSENLYYADGTPYTGNVFQVKMLVEEYEAEYYMELTGGEGRTITLTTAGSRDSLYPYRGTEGTRCTILRSPRMTGSQPMITAKSNLTLTNIVLDGNRANVTPTASTRIITANYGSAQALQITLGRNATLENAETTGNGGGVYLNYGACLTFTGGSIRGCAAANGGGVYIDGGKGTMTMSVGTITMCSATGNGGGVFFNKGQVDSEDDPAYGFIRISGGSISRCTAANGGGIYLNSGNGSRRLYMSGGSIAQNSVTGKGGGIAVGDKNARIYFSGAPFVYKNTSSSASTPADCISPYQQASNVQMDQTWSPLTAAKPNTVIVSRGLSRGASIGVYVPDNDSLYEKHGAERDPFATFENKAGMSYFINDRNGMKGGQLDEASETDKKIYWRKIYSLSVTKQVLSDNPRDEQKIFRFEVELTGTIPGTGGAPDTLAEEFSGQKGDMNFTNGKANITLSNGQTKIADLLPLGFGYKVTELLTTEQQGDFKTSTENDAGVIGQMKDESGHPYTTGMMLTATKFNYSVTFSNLHAVCKIVGKNANGEQQLLYARSSDTGSYIPAVYSAVVTAFNHVNAGDLSEWYYKTESGQFERFYPVSTSIEMLVPEYTMTLPASLLNGQETVLTTASRDATDGFPYVGGSAAAVITRGYSGESMFTVDQADLTIGRITLDGGSGSCTSNENGGIVQVRTGSKLTAGDGATLQNSTTSGNGAAVYLAEGSKMYISGNPVFGLNTTTANLGGGATNGGEAYNTARQDIYIAGYQNADAASLTVTGNLNGDPGSIWVWAEASRHYEQSRQFAVMQGGTGYTGLNVFRNAQTDTRTKNPLKTDPRYLYGMKRGSDGKVYWSGSMDLSISKAVTGEFSDPADQFPFTVSGLGNGESCEYTRYTSTDGTTWVKETGSGAAGVLTANADGELSFTLSHHQKIVISIPGGTTVTVTETPGYYLAKYAIDDLDPADGSTTGAFALNADTSVAFTNERKAVAPTGIRTGVLPYFLMMLTGLCLIPVFLTGRRRSAARKASRKG